jgi:acetyl esterase/lipase
MSFRTGGLVQVLLRSLLRFLLRPLLGTRFSISVHRRTLPLVANGTPAVRGTHCTAIELASVPTERVESGMAAAKPGAILFFHGGGYCIGAPATHRSLTSRLSRATDIAVYAPDYRLAPEHPHPAALDDAVSAYRGLLALGMDGGHIVIAGDSAGGGLTLACAIALRDAGLPPPSALILLSPWVDLDCNGSTMRSHANRDPVLTPDGLRRWGRAYLAGRSAATPACSPLQAELRGLPPTLIQVGSEEILLDDSRRLHQRLIAAGVASRLHEYEGLWHDFQLQGGVLQGADEAIKEIAVFIAQRRSLTH